MSRPYQENEQMDYKSAWIALREEMRATILSRLRIGVEIDDYANVLCTMIDVEDKARGIDIMERHNRELSPSHVIALYEAFDRVKPETEAADD